MRRSLSKARQSWVIQWGLLMLAIALVAIPFTRPWVDGFLIVCMWVWLGVLAVTTAVAEKMTRQSDEAAFLVGEALLQHGPKTLAIRGVLNIAPILGMFYIEQSWLAIGWALITAVSIGTTQRCLKEFKQELAREQSDYGGMH